MKKYLYFFESTADRFPQNQGQKKIADAVNQIKGKPADDPGNSPSDAGHEKVGNGTQGSEQKPIQSQNHRPGQSTIYRAYDPDNKKQ